MDYFIYYWMSYYDIRTNTYREKGQLVLEIKKLRILLEDVEYFELNYLYKHNWFLLFDIKPKDINIVESDMQKILNKYE